VVSVEEDVCAQAKFNSDFIAELNDNIIKITSVPTTTVPECRASLRVKDGNDVLMIEGVDYTYTHPSIITMKLGTYHIYWALEFDPTVL
jgi:hypothetical protein